MRTATIVSLLMAGVFLLAGPLCAGETDVGGEVHAFWILHLNDQGQLKNYSAFDISRAFIDIKHRFSDKFSARVTADIYRTAGENRWDLRAQYAYVQIDKLLPYTDMRFGLQGLVWADRVDEVWGLRYVDVASMEKLGYLHYADFGGSLYGVCPGEWGEIVVQVMNGSGYTESELNKYKDFVVFATVTPLINYPEFKESGVWFQYYKGWPNREPMTGYSFSDNTKKDRISAAALIKYRHWFTAYADFFMLTDDFNQTPDVDTTITGVDLPQEEKATGLTVLGKVNIATSEIWLSDIFIFGKYEWVDKHGDHEAPGLELYADEDDAKYIIVGAGYELADGFELAVSVRRSTVNRIETDEDDNPLRIQETEKNSLLVSMKGSF